MERSGGLLNSGGPLSAPIIGGTNPQATATTAPGKGQPPTIPTMRQVTPQLQWGQPGQGQFNLAPNALSTLGVQPADFQTFLSSAQQGKQGFHQWMQGLNLQHDQSHPLQQLANLFSKHYGGGAVTGDPLPPGTPGTPGTPGFGGGTGPIPPTWLTI